MKAPCPSAKSLSMREHKTQHEWWEKGKMHTKHIARPMGISIANSCKQIMET